MNYFFIAAVGSLLFVACGNRDAKKAGATTSREDSIKHSQMMEMVTDTTNFTTLQWIDSMHQNLGMVKEGAQVEVSWRFKNTGNKPLIISQATASCGCTVAEKPEEPVAPGKEGRIRAKFNSEGRAGTQSKQVYVIANSKESTTHTLSFGVDVQKK